jgi:predicted small lipoprotein YifL
MLRTIPILIVLATITTLAACGGDGAANPNPEADKHDIQATDAPATVQQASEPAPAAPSVEADTAEATQESAPAVTLLLRDLNPDEPIPVADLQTAYFAWGEQPVVIGGYLNVPTRRGRINRRISLTSEPGAELSMAGCRIEDPSGERVQSDQPIVIKGTMRRYSGKPSIDLDDCEVVSIGEAFDQSTPATPGLEAPIPVGTLYQALTDWYGKEITVVGYYRGSGHSSANDKTSVALAPGAGKTSAVNCNIPGQDVVPASVAAQREGVVMRGTVGDATWPQVVLEDCTFVNRQ